MAEPVVVNRHHPQQDIDRVRPPNPTRYRYGLADRLLPPAGPGARLLDVGGGSGEFTEIARAKGYTTHLVDGNATSVAAEIDRGHDASTVDLNLGLPGIPEAMFDVCACLDVIEHLVPSELVLEAIHERLKPGGLLILSTPNFAFVRDRIRYARGRSLREEGYHYRFFTKAGLLSDLSQTGFALEASASPAKPLVVRSIVRTITRGRWVLGDFDCPSWAESWLTPTFVWSLRKTAPVR